MSKKAKLITIITSVAVAVALIVLTICLIVANNNREKTCCSIASITAGTSIHLVLNENDKVLDVVALDDQAKGIALNNNLEGMKYAEAVKLFVTKNVEAGYLDANTEGYSIKIAINGNRKDYSKYQKSMKESVNNYLSDMGIVAGTRVSNLTLASIVKELKPTAQNTDTLSSKELLAKYTTIVTLIENVLPSNYAELFDVYDALDNDYNTTVREASDLISTRRQQIADLEAEIANLPEGDEKNTKLQTIETYEANIESAQRSLDSAEQTLTNDVGELVTLRSRNKDKENQALSDAYNANVTSNSAVLDAHKSAFENDKQTTLDKIDAYRKTIEA